MRWLQVSGTFLNPRVQDLSNQLPNYCLKAKAANTRKAYRYAYDNFTKWCASFDQYISPLPATEETVSMYLIHVPQTFNSVSKILLALFAISWMHKLAGLPDPSLSSLCKQVKEGAVRDCSKPVVKKEPIKAQHLYSLVQNLANDDYSLLKLRTITMCLLGYARFSELSNIKRQDITFYEDHVSIFLPHSKTDKHKQGTFVKIAKTATITCTFSLCIKLGCIPATAPTT